jgi:hypothetical protein
MKFDYIFALKYNRVYVRVISHEYVYSATLYQLINTADEDTIWHCNMGKTFQETSNPN